MNLVRKSMFTALITLSTASVYYAQSIKDTLSKEKSIDEVVISGVADIAKDRKTPVAVSTIKEAQIVEKLGNQEFPEILNSTPSVYATKGGGGFGDSRLTIRGFAQANIAVLVNGVPVNDMENGSVYWSNWAGLSDVTTSLQVQRGLGSSKLAIASVGGTVNILTRAADKKEGGKFDFEVANNGYVKTLLSYNTGKKESGWSSSFLLSRTGGGTYVQGTQFEGYNYYFALGYQHKNHDFQFTLTGAPQTHDQRSTYSTISNYIKYNSDNNGNPDRTYNPDWGYQNGQIYSNKVNYYHKPVMSLNWDWKISDKSKLATVAYASFGRGGGASDLGGVGGNFITSTPFRTATGQINYDAIYAANGAANPATGPANGTLVQANSINSHNWFGLISSFNQSLTDHLKISLGVDTRYYQGFHYQVLTNLYGASGYKDAKNFNLLATSTPYNLVSNTYSTNPDWNPFGGKLADFNDRVGYSYHSDVLWYGGFGQLEYSTDKLSVYAQGAVSNQGFQRSDDYIINGVTLLNNTQAGTPASNQPTASNPALNSKTGYKYLLGYNAKVGINYNVDEQNNVFGNIGYYSKQPFLNAVYPNNQNNLNPNLTNEKIFGMELGYGFRSAKLTANVNVYRTSWKDRYLRQNQQYTDANNNIISGYANIQGITELHQGVEVEAKYKVLEYLTLDGSYSMANWYYKGNATGSLFDNNNNPAQLSSGSVSSSTLYLDKVKVGNSAQNTAYIGATIEPIKDFRINGGYRYADRLYANLNVSNFTNVAAQDAGALRLPNFGVTDLGASYKINVKSNRSFTLRVNVFNVFDKTYISEASSNIISGLSLQQYAAINNLSLATPATTASTTAKYNTYAAAGDYKGVNKSNTVFFGFGRTWSTTLSFNF